MSRQKTLMSYFSKTTEPASSWTPSGSTLGPPKAKKRRVGRPKKIWFSLFLLLIPSLILLLIFSLILLLILSLILLLIFSLILLLILIQFRIFQVIAMVQVPPHLKVPLPHYQFPLKVRMAQLLFLQVAMHEDLNFVTTFYIYFLIRTRYSATQK